MKFRFTLTTRHWQSLLVWPNWQIVLPFCAPLNPLLLVFSCLVFLTSCHSSPLGVFLHSTHLTHALSSDSLRLRPPSLSLSLSDLANGTEGEWKTKNGKAHSVTSKQQTLSDRSSASSLTPFASLVLSSSFSSFSSSSPPPPSSSSTCDADYSSPNSHPCKQPLVTTTFTLAPQLEKYILTVLTVCTHLAQITHAHSLTFTFTCRHILFKRQVHLERILSSNASVFL